MKPVCHKCQNTGQYLGLGMMLTDCHHAPMRDCEATPTPTPTVSIDRRSKAYRDAINSLMNLNPDMGREEAVKLFDKTYAEV